MLLPHRRYGRFRGEFVSSYQLIYVVIINMGMDPFTSYFDVHQGYKVLTHCHISKISKVNICPYSCGIGSLLQTRTRAGEENPLCLKEVSERQAPLHRREAWVGEHHPWPRDVCGLIQV